MQYLRYSINYTSLQCLAIELNRTVLDDGLNVNLTCLCQRSTITRKPGIYCGPTNAQRCTRYKGWLLEISIKYHNRYGPVWYLNKIYFSFKEQRKMDWRHKHLFQKAIWRLLLSRKNYLYNWRCKRIARGRSSWSNCATSRINKNFRLFSK